MTFISHISLLSNKKLKCAWFCTLIVGTMIFLPLLGSSITPSRLESKYIDAKEFTRLATADSIETEIEVLWNKTYGTEYEENVKSLIQCSNGDYVLTGYINNSNDYDVLVMRFAENGTSLWNRTYGGPEEDIGYEIIECAGGDGLAVIATYTNTTAVHDNKDLLLIRIADNGTTLWNQTYKGPDEDESSTTDDMGRSIVECPNGDFVLAGATIIDDYDVYLVRVSSTGTEYTECR